MPSAVKEAIPANRIATGVTLVSRDDAVVIGVLLVVIAQMQVRDGQLLNVSLRGGREKWRVSVLVNTPHT